MRLDHVVNFGWVKVESVLEIAYYCCHLQNPTQA